MQIKRKNETEKQEIKENNGWCMEGV